ncbi:hypothetical protein NLX78_22870 [Paenibacillus sp. Lou8.1]|uniref:hypothetical protein n=1 Tax=Paenibacillus sp. Lou8.1 TaxID=2962041 RepID=UPI0020B87781|nr:hypothetical protein [Paenibacillus sp. Lou8.1]MCP3810067.1 hypothetical protein [Paenibacillus sp. Lou8.1]
MEDQLEVQDTGVEEASAAEMQQETGQESLQSEQVDTNTGVEDSEVAAQNDEKGFAKALKAREEQIRAQLEQEYGTKAKDAEKYQQALDRTAKYYGFDNHDDYMAALEQAEMDQRIQREAEKLNVDESVIREHLQPLNQKVSEYEKQLNELREADALRQVEAQIAAMEKDDTQYPDFGKYKNDVINLAATNGYTLDVAYKLFTYDERVNTAKTQAEQEAIRKLQQNADSSTGSLGADAPDQKGGYLGMTQAERKAFRDSRRGRVN